MANCSVNGWRSRQGAKWYPTDGSWKAIGSSTGASLFIASNPGGNNKYTLLVKITTPNDAGIASINSITVKFRAYKANNNAGTLYGSLRTKYDDLGSRDTYSTMRNNAVGSEASSTYHSTSWGDFSFTFTGTFSKNTSYYFVLYTKSNSDMYYTTAAGFQPTATCATTATTYTIKYNANGGSGAPSSQTKIYGKTLTLSSTKPTKSQGSNTVSGSFVITGNGNGGYFGNTSTTTTSITATSSTPQTITYTFSKWKDGSGNEYAAGGSYTANSAATLTAQYTSSTSNGTTTYSNNSISKLATPSRGSSKVATYTVSFNANGGSCSTSSLTADKTRTFTFKGWAESSTATSTLVTNKTYTAAKTVYAVWGQSDSTAAINLPTPTRSGYTFRGWATDASASSGTTGLYEPEGNITLYAIWSQDYSTVYYNDNGKCVACCVYYNNNGTAVLCNVYYNNNGSAVQI